MKVLVSDKFSPEGLKIFEQAEGMELEYHPGISAEALLKAVEDVDALVVRGGTQVTEEVFQAAKKLSVVGRAGIGIENMDLVAANRKGVVVMNTPFGSTTTTAEHTIAMLMALARQIPEASRSTKAGLWEKDRFLGTEITGKTFGVIGAGKSAAWSWKEPSASRCGSSSTTPTWRKTTCATLGPSWWNSKTFWPAPTSSPCTSP